MKNLSLDQKHRFNALLLSIAVPVMVQNLLGNSLSFLDTLMIGQLGDTAIAAVGLGNQVYFLISLLLFGITSGSSIFLSQYWGAKDEQSIQKMLGISTTIAFIGAFICFIASTFAPKAVMRIFIKDPQVVEIGATYLRIVGVSYLFSAMTQIFGMALRVIGNAKVPMVASIISLAVNATGNFLLIFGIGIFPELGVAGAAISTTIARLLEILLLLSHLHRTKSPVALRFRQAFSWDRHFVARIAPTCLPVIANEFFWALGMTVYKIAYSRMGVDAIAAINVTESISNLFFVALSGLGNASLIMIGVKIGEHDKIQALGYTRRFLFLGLLVGIGSGILEALFAPQFAQWFKVTGDVSVMVVHCLYIWALLLPSKSLNMIAIVGILRSGGDTRFAMFAELFGVWCIGVPLAFIGSMVLGLSLEYVYLLVGLEEIVKMVLSMLRIHSGKWLNDLTAVH